MRAVSDDHNTATTRTTIGARCCAALVVVFLHFGPYLSMLLRAETRRLRMWTRGDTLELFGGMIMIAAVAVAIDEIMRRCAWHRVRRVYHHLFIVGLAGGLLTNLWYHTVRPVGYHIGQMDTEVRSLWFLVMVGVGYSLARPQWGLLRWSRRAALVLSPTVAIVAVQLISQPSYPPRLEPLKLESTATPVAAQAQPAGNPVFLLVFDGWSHDRSFEAGTPGALMPHLAKFSQQAMVFAEARSPGACTEQSMPRLLMQTDMPVRWGDARVEFIDGERVVPPAQLTSLFAEVDPAYTTCAIGYYMPYRLLLGDQIDLCRVYHWPLYNRTSNMVFNLGRDLWAAMMYWTDPWCGLAYRKCRRPLLDSMTLWTYAAMKGDMLEVIEHGPRETFALFHYPMPHDPYLLDDDGRYRGSRARAGWTDHSEWAGYRRNIRCADRLIGELITALKQAGKYDDALIIVTSDHTWVYDRDLGDKPKNHVPLVIKLPGQDRRIDVTPRFSTVNLGQFIARAHRRSNGAIDVDTLLGGIIGPDSATIAQTEPGPSPTGE